MRLKWWAFGASYETPHVRGDHPNRSKNVQTDYEANIEWVFMAMLKEVWRKFKGQHNQGATELRASEREICL